MPVPVSPQEEAGDVGIPDCLERQQELVHLAVDTGVWGAALLRRDLHGELLRLADPVDLLEVVDVLDDVADVAVLIRQGDGDGDDVAALIRDLPVGYPLFGGVDLRQGGVAPEGAVQLCR